MVKPNTQVAMNKNSDPVQRFFLRGGWGDSAPYSNFSKLLELSETSRGKKLTLGLQVNIDKANNRRCDFTQ